MIDTRAQSLLAEIRADRETGTEDAWWRSRIDVFVLDEDYGDDENVNGGQDAADRRRIFRLPAVERALIEAVELRDTLAQDRERFAATVSHTVKRLTAARDAWDAFKAANTTEAHFAAVYLLDALLCSKTDDSPAEPGSDPAPVDGGANG